MGDNEVLIEEPIQLDKLYEMYSHDTKQFTDERTLPGEKIRKEFELEEQFFSPKELKALTKGYSLAGVRYGLTFPEYFINPFSEESNIECSKIPKDFIVIDIVISPEADQFIIYDSHKILTVEKEDNFYTTIDMTEKTDNGMYHLCLTPKLNSKGEEESILCFDIFHIKKYVCEDSADLVGISLEEWQNKVLAGNTYFDAIDRSVEKEILLPEIDDVEEISELCNKIFREGLAKLYENPNIEIAPKQEETLETLEEPQKPENETLNNDTNQYSSEEIKKIAQAYERLKEISGIELSPEQQRFVELAKEQ